MRCKTCENRRRRRKISTKARAALEAGLESARTDIASCRPLAPWQAVTVAAPADAADVRAGLDEAERGVCPANCVTCATLADVRAGLDEAERGELPTKEEALAYLHSLTDDEPYTDEERSQDERARADVKSGKGTTTADLLGKLK